MKKIAFLVSMMFVTIAVAAQPVITGTSRIVLSTAGQPDKQVNFILSASFSDAWDNTWDAEAANPGGIYVFANGERYTTWATNAYSENLAIGFASCDNSDYTLKFQNFNGVAYTIYDRVARETINVNGSTPDYLFTIDNADKNQSLNDRFVINYDADGLDVCFIDNKLTINSNPFTEPIVIKDANGDEIAGSPFAASTPLVDMTAIGAAGDRFTVEFAGGARKFIIVKQ